MSGGPVGTPESGTLPSEVSARLAPALWKALDRLDALGVACHQAGVRALTAHRDLEKVLAQAHEARLLEPYQDRYAALTADRVLGPLVGTLRKLDVGVAMAETWIDLQTGLSGAVRYASSVRFDGSKKLLEKVVRYHVTVRLPTALQPLFLSRARDLGRWGHQLERGGRAWWEAFLATEAETGPADTSEPDDPVTSARAVLGRVLEEVSEFNWPSVREEAGQRIADAEVELAADLQDALEGRFKRHIPASDPVAWKEIVSAQERWSEWHREMAARIALEVTLIRVRHGLFGLVTTHIDAVREAAEEIGRLAEAQGSALRSLADELQERCSGGGLPGRDELESWMTRCLEPLEGELAQAVSDFAGPEGGPALSGERMADAAYRLVATQPESFVVHRVAEGDDADPTASPIVFEFRRVVAQCVDALLIERLRETPAGVIDAADRLQLLGREVPEIVHSAFTALIEEVDSGQFVSDDTTSGDDLAAMVPEALRRAAGVAERVAETALEGLSGWEEDAREIIDVGWMRLSERAVVSSGVGEQWAGLRSGAAIKFRESLDDTLSGWGARYRALSRRIGQAWRAGRRLFVWLERGESDAGTRLHDPVLEFLGRSHQLGAGLPLVYRKLFSAEGMREPSLLVDRDAITERVGAGVDGTAIRTLLVVAHPGSGVSSLFHALGSDPVRQGGVVRVVLTERIDTASSLLTCFANEGVADHGFGLRGLAAQVVDEMPGTERPLILVDGLEHLFLRRSGGADLLRSFLSAMRESSDCVAWVVGISSVAWQVVLKMSPHLAAGLDVLPMVPLDREALEMAMWRRHQRSGIPLTFLEPDDASPLLARRLRRTRSEERRRQLLRNGYFDRLHGLSSGWMGLALALWLDGLALDGHTGEAALSFPRPIDETFLEGLQLEEVFALKAFLEHGSLTAVELQDVLRVTHGDAERILEHLRALCVVEPVPHADDAAFTGPWVERCRLRGVALPLVWRFLERRNVLHV